MRRLLVPGLSALVVLGCLLALGTWQVSRLAWKEDLIAQTRERPAMATLALPPLAAIADAGALDALIYRRVRFSGQFEPAGQVHVFTVLSDARGDEEGPGYWLMTPFRLDSGALVMVNRGFVPQRFIDRKEGEAADPAILTPPTGETTLTGLVRPSEAGNFMTPKASPEKGLYFIRDVAQIARTQSLSGPLYPLSIDMDPLPGVALPQAGETRMQFTNNHLPYAATWYGLALVLMVIFIPFARARLRDPV